MSLKKELVAVGLSGLTPWEAAKGALMCEDFQKMPDPFGKLIKEMKPQEKLDKDTKSWFALGEVVGLDIIEDNDVAEFEQTEEDKEVEQIVKKGKETKRKILRAVRTVATGHKMLAEGLKTVQEGWALFEEACQAAGPGYRPQLLRSLKGMSTPIPPLILMDVVKPGSPGTPKRPATPAPSSSPVKKEQQGGHNPVVIVVDGKRKWTCPQCCMVVGSKNGCDAHIRQVHTGETLVCALCSFSSYNLDSLYRHEKEHN